MRVDNRKLEVASANFYKKFSTIFSLGYVEITHNVINTAQKFISTLPTDYDWHRHYWHNDLDLKIKARCKHFFHLWHGPAYKSYYQGNIRTITKIDLCSDFNEGYELFSVAYHETLSPRFIDILKIRAAVCHYVAETRHTWQDDMFLPLRATIAPRAQDNPPCFFFDDIHLTHNEMQTIRSLLMLKSIKEIAAQHHCTVTAEKNRINRIKFKLGCAHQPLSHLFAAFKKRGITVACLDTYTTFQ